MGVSAAAAAAVTLQCYGAARQWGNRHTGRSGMSMHHVPLTCTIPQCSAIAMIWVLQGMIRKPSSQSDSECASQSISQPASESMSHRRSSVRSAACKADRGRASSLRCACLRGVNDMHLFLLPLHVSRTIVPSILSLKCISWPLPVLQQLT